MILFPLYYFVKNLAIDCVDRITFIIVRITKTKIIQHGLDYHHLLDLSEQFSYLRIQVLLTYLLKMASLLDVTKNQIQNRRIVEVNQAFNTYFNLKGNEIIKMQTASEKMYLTQISLHKEFVENLFDI